MSQAKLGDELNLKRSRISSYEQGNVEPSAKEFLKISKYFKVSPEMMVEELITNDSESFIKADPEKHILEQDLINENLNNFIYYTNELTKIKEGYEIFYKIKLSEIEEESAIQTLKRIEDVLLIFEKLIAGNWTLIQSIKSHTE
jgi:transcriptional regulator with XRE-family HTH domain